MIKISFNFFLLKYLQNGMAFYALNLFLCLCNSQFFFFFHALLVSSLFWLVWKSWSVFNDQCFWLVVCGKSEFSRILSKWDLSNFTWHWLLLSFNHSCQFCSPWPIFKVTPTWEKSKWRLLFLGKFLIQSSSDLFQTLNECYVEWDLSKCPWWCQWHPIELNNSTFKTVLWTLTKVKEESK